jgi:DNA gyrase subunit B
MSKRIVEDEIRSFDDDRDKVRVAPLMYISRLGVRGAVHLCKEIINNNIDEAINPHSVGFDIHLSYYTKTNMFVSEDNGRGFPLNAIEKACCKMQAGSKFNRQTGGATAGQNGAGLTACNALSKYFSIEAYKLGEYAKVEFVDGKQTLKPKVIKIQDKKKHGSIVAFEPDPKYMGECTIDINEIVNWLSLIQHVLDKRITIDLTIYDDNYKKKEKYVFKRRDGIVDTIKQLESGDTSKAVAGENIIDFKERIRIVEDNNNVTEKDVPRELKVEYAFLLDSKLSEYTAVSLCNYVHTVDGGHHIDAIKNAICYYLSGATKALLTDKEKEKYDILFSDITSSLVLSGSILTDIDPGFTGQTKEKVDNPGLVKPIQQMVRLSLDDYFKKNPQVLKKMCQIVKINAKGRLEANKVKNAVVKREYGSISEYSIPKYSPANNKDKYAYRELFIVEGDSVSGNIDAARDKDFQALFAIRGYPEKVFTSKVYEVVENDELRNMIKTFNCGIGENTNPKQCRFKKIILTPDSDADGGFIFSLLCSMFIKHLPQLVEAGMVYKSCPPLYKIQDKKQPFIVSREQMINVFERRIGDNVRIVDPKTKSVMNKTKFTEFLLVNRQYLEEITRLSNHFAVNALLIEFILFNRYNNKFEKDLKKKFPEMSVDDSGLKDSMLLTGIIDGKYQMIYVDKIFDKKCKKMMKIIKSNELVEYEVLEKRDKDYENIGKLTLGQFFQRVQKYYPKIVMRYKGLGELSSDDLWETTMNPNNRILVRLTIREMEDELRKFNILHGNADEERKAMVNTFQLDREFLDN